MNATFEWADPLTECPGRGSKHINAGRLAPVNGGGRVRLASGTSLTAGQRALEVVLTGKLQRTVIGLAAELGVTSSCVSEAKAVLSYAPEAVGLVIDCSKPRNEAYEVAVSRERIRFG